MNNGAVRPGAGDGRKARIAVILALFAEPQQLVGSRDFRKLTLGRFFREPFKEPADCNAVANMGSPGALELGFVLDCLRQAARIGRLEDPGPGILERTENRRRGGRRIGHDGTPLKSAEIVDKAAFRMDRDLVPEPLPQFVCGLRFVQKKHAVAVASEDRVGKRDRRVQDVGRAYVKQPGDRIEGGKNYRVGVLTAQLLGQPRALVSRLLAGKLEPMNNHRLVGLTRAVKPGRINRVVFDRHQLGALEGQCIGKLFDPADGVQQRIVADPHAIGEVFGQPVLGRLLLEVAACKKLAVHLRLDLQRITAVGKGRRFVHQNDGAAERAREAADPSQPLSTVGHIFALVFVGQWNDKTIQVSSLELFAQSRQATFNITCAHRCSAPRFPSRYRNSQSVRLLPLPHIQKPVCNRWQKMSGKSDNVAY